ncbi:MAG: hypothetical protein J6T32_02730 [Paludibacteraceae bacterium]|nr:hypothetical protein [Paludibacteraceae bacterium]MBP5318616.1 hypothetical protein [Paludibacteraceae bacterium]
MNSDEKYQLIKEYNSLILWTGFDLIQNGIYNYEKEDARVACHKYERKSISTYFYSIFVDAITHLPVPCIPTYDRYDNSDTDGIKRWLDDVIVIMDMNGNILYEENVFTLGDSIYIQYGQYGISVSDLPKLLKAFKEVSQK